MRHIRILNKKYPIISHDDDILLIHKDGSNELLAEIMNELEDKIIFFTNEVEKKLNEIFEMNHLKQTELFNSLNKIPAIDSPDTTNRLIEVVTTLSDLRDESDKQFEDLITYIKSSLDENFDDDIGFLKFSSMTARSMGDYQEAIKIQELTKKRIHQLTDLLKDLCSCTETKVNDLYISFLQHVQDKFYFIYKSSTSNNLDEEDTNRLNSSKSNNSSSRIPRTSLELKKHLKKEGFTLDRHNGSHKIYKNSEGEVRLIPARRGNHVLAAKTAKKVYQGLKVSNE